MTICHVGASYLIEPPVHETADRLTRETILVRAGGPCFAGGARWHDCWVCGCR